MTRYAVILINTREDHVFPLGWSTHDTIEEAEKSRLLFLNEEAPQNTHLVFSPQNVQVIQYEV